MQHLEIGDKKKSSLTSCPVSKSQLSLTSLTSSAAQSQVIQALSEDKPGHIPYRESKLTRLLQVRSEEEISYFIFRSLTFSECLMRASYSPCGNDPKSEKKPLIAVTRKPYRSLTFRNGHIIAESSIFLLV